jgi:hypothetical protein
MDIRTLSKLFLQLTAVVAISACQTLVVSPVPDYESESVSEPDSEAVAQQPEQEIEPEIVPPPDDLPASVRVRKALEMLEQGDYENARNQLDWALQEKPGLQIADTLIQQIDADPVDYLGVKNFYYKVESGDSLSIIAGKFLEDPMKFVILARYNKLENPSKLAPGDRIRVGIIGFGGEGESLVRHAGFAHPDWVENARKNARENPRDKAFEVYMGQQDLNVQLTAARSPSITMSSIVRARSGNAVNQ